MTAPQHLDANIRQRRAVDPDASVWVEANAGTGKTKVLTDRIVRLLLGGVAPQRILCLTFTKAAAAEMRNRLSALLGRWALAPADKLADEVAGLVGREPGAGDLVTARRLFARVLDAPGGIAIQTIHSFCQALLQRFPLEAGVAPNFAILEEGRATELLTKARDAQLSDLAVASDDDPLAVSLRAVGRRVSDSEYVAIMDALLRERGRLRRLAGDAATLDAYLARLRGWLGAPEDGATADDVIAAACEDAAFDGPALRRATTALATGSKTDIEKSAAMAAWLSTPVRRAATIDDYGSVFLTKDGGVRKTLATQKTAKAAPGIVEDMTAEALRVARAFARARAAALVELTGGLLRLGGDILTRYEKLKSAHAALDYEDLVLHARDLLTRPGVAPWVLYKLDGGLDHVLVDEAQDTNPDQWDVVARLTDEFFSGGGAVERPRSVFAVGDAKQSIFGFQRADPAKLAEMRHRFDAQATGAGGRFENVELIDSFRSVGAILDAVDLVFGEGAAAQGVSSSDAPITHKTTRGGQPGVVELWPVVRPVEAVDGDDEPLRREDSLAPPDERLAKAIAAHARGLIDRGERLADSGEAIHPGHMMVLVRRRNAFVNALVRELKRVDIAVAGVDRVTLTDELAVEDALALGRFALLPQDDLNLACLLKSPLIGLDEEALFALAHDRPGRLWAALRTKAEAGDERFMPAFGTLSAWLARADFTPPFEFFAEILGRERGRVRLLERLGREAGDPLDEFLSMALRYQREETPSLQGFLRWIETGGSEIKRDLDANRRRELRILTVHASKGLQAPIVYLPDTCRVPRPTNRLLWSNDGGTLVWAPRKGDSTDAAEALAQEAKRREGEEQNRLLYVAMTRAADRLYIAGWAGERDPDAGCWHELVSAAFTRAADRPDAPPRGPDARALPRKQAFDFSATLGPRDGWKGDGWRLASGDLAPPMTQTALPLPVVSPLPSWAARPPAPEPDPPLPLAPSRPFAEDGRGDPNAPAFEPPPLGPFLPDHRRRFRRGLAIHRLLQLLPDVAPERRAAAGARLLMSIAIDTPESERAAWLAETMAVMDDPAHAALFAPDSRAETPVVGTVRLRAGSYAVSGQIDRLAVTAGEVLIVDYKTNRPPPADAADVPMVYRRQMALYRDIVARIYPGRRVRCFLLWTDGPRLMPLSTESLAAALP
ncbi:MAG: double-strand break repair helicase AddA [Rhodospirillales bacterium]|nr:MAG: double-strand break repair helicase AddA [Rhodospirillales bacterium]